MRERLIIVPIDKEAEENLDFDTATKDQLIELCLSENDFILLYNNRIIDLINKAGNTNIDDFEDDVVKGEKNLRNVILALNNILKSTDSDLFVLIKEILKVFEEAFARNTGVYFYF